MISRYSRGMLPAYQSMTRVLPGGQITVTEPTLREGQLVEVIVMPRDGETAMAAGGQGVLDFLNSLPKVERPAEYWEEREREFQAERDSWDR